MWLNIALYYIDDCRCEVKMRSELHTEQYICAYVVISNALVAVHEQYNSTPGLLLTRCSIYLNYKYIAFVTNHTAVQLHLETAIYPVQVYSRPKR